jgi:hypothetical protein
LDFSRFRVNFYKDRKRQPKKVSAKEVFPVFPKNSLSEILKKVKTLLFLQIVKDGV